MYRMKRLLAELLSAVMLLSLLPAAAMAAAFTGGGGSGTDSDPYLITTKEQLVELQNYVNDGNNSAGLYFKLTADIDLEGEEWTPIGSGYVVPFRGTFDGDGHTISGLNVNTWDSAGLFGIVYNGHIKNLGVSGTVTSSDRAAGGIVGEMGDYDAMEGSITNCHSSVTVTGSGYVGGIVGQNYGNRISNCYNTGVISNDSSHTGGIAGANFGGVIENCYNTGAVSGVNRVGGITGINEGRSKPAEVSNCYNTGTVSGSSTVGGIVGENRYSVTNCYYLYACGAGGEGTVVEHWQFDSGEIAYLLQKGQSTLTWGQKLGGDDADEYPILTDEESYRTYQITFLADWEPDYEARLYANPGKGVGIVPEIPRAAGYVPVKWALTNSPDGVAFTGSTVINGDMTVYAIHELGGNLVVSVTVSGEGADPSREWKFRVEIDDPYYYGDDFLNGMEEFTLKAGESRTISNLAPGTKYTVTELNGNADDYTTSYTNERGVIVSGETMIAAFTNVFAKTEPEDPSDPGTSSEPTDPAPSEDPSGPGTSSEPTEPAPSKGPETSEDPQNPTGRPSGEGSNDQPSGTPNDPPKTGDEGQLSLWLALMLLSLAGAGATALSPIISRKRPAGANGRH